MTYNEIGYHGTKKANQDGIIGNGFHQSVGERHWLGDGVYFFTEAFHAYKWRYDACRDNMCRQGKAFELDCLIIQARINTLDERVFDLTKYQHKLVFDEILNTIEMIKPRSCWEKKAVAEGVAFNYMFNVLADFRRNYDAVKALFQWRGKMLKSFNLKLSSDKPQMQICVKNELMPSGEQTIQSIGIYDYNDEIDNLEKLRVSWSYSARNRQHRNYR